LAFPPVSANASALNRARLTARLTVVRVVLLIKPPILGIVHRTIEALK